MELRSLFNYKSAFSLVKVVVVLLIVLIPISIAINNIIITQKIDDLLKKVIVIDRKGEIYNTELKKMAETRVYEYENHVSIFYNLWYSFDENSYKPNIEKALFLIGEKGIEMLNQYKDAQVEQKLYQGNLVIRSEIKDIKVDVSTNPISGFIIGVQTIKRPSGEIKRNMNCKFTLYDVDRSRNNPHGCKIKDWTIFDNNKIE